MPDDADPDQPLSDPTIAAPLKRFRGHFRCARSRLPDGRATHFLFPLTIEGLALPDHDQLTVEHEEDGALLVDGWIDIRHVSKLLDVDLVDEADRYSTLAGLVLWRLGHLPNQGESVSFGGLTYEVVALDGRNVDKVRIRRPQLEEMAGAQFR
ncbi:hypothetical protein JVX98_00555 (plasmid) [Ensifer sp. PDNC004]|uniref:transporter associated domain-containing protein n=1 Tax=Ensifer sp. PDNC004 TaxID=2811423 RepID=UPI001965C2EF|nr:transporter associated domain-containing protein [Ensifer sp. PDNC004]QRY65630.1 hypothetical protein JVX98_00555 [Ensifer sp. PDNC004]